jgi:hypothetical protein
MLIRISGGTDGIKKYLEEGQKQGRGFSRDELDERVVLAGDLEVTDSVIQSMDGDGERYLHITLAFKEDELDREKLAAVVRDFEAFAFSAYAKDEYSFYAEAHLPRIKSYNNARTGEFVERKPHIHIIVPKVNLLGAMHLNPFGVVLQNEQFIDAFQEHVNNKYGLASPKDNRRIEFTGESEMISRYKGDVFAGGNQELKGAILDRLLSEEIDRYDAFRAMLAEFGATRTRNEGKDAEYQNVKPAGNGKGVNLKEYVFSRQFVELSGAEKRKRLAADVQREYEVAGQVRRSPQVLEVTLRQWHEVRAREVKYLNSGNRKAWQEYREADQAGRHRLLAEKEVRFYAKHRQEQTHGQGQGDGGRAARDVGRVGREFGFKRAPGAERAMGADRTKGRDHRQRDFGPDPQGTAPESLNRVRSLSSVGVVGFAQRGEVLLPDHAADHLVDEGADRAHPLRRPGAGERGLNDTGRQADSVVSQVVRDHQERKQARSAEGQTEFQAIKQQLDARRLLVELSQSHGVIPEKYEVTKAKDGSDRIRCGTRNLNVSDFLTKELNLPWLDAAGVLRAAYARQRGQEPMQEAKREPRRKLWAEFQAQQRANAPQLRAVQWDEQRAKERERHAAIKTVFYAMRSKAQSDRSLQPAQRKAAVSIARMERLTKETALRARVRAERERLTAEQRRPALERYRDFLAGLAQAGDEDALGELRRMRPDPAERGSAPEDQVTPAEPWVAPYSAPIHRAPAITYQVHRNGDVTYQRDGRDMLRDAGRAVQLLQQDAQTIETALRLAQQKFGNSLMLHGTQQFQETAARVAAEAGLRVEFTDQRLNRIMQDRRVELDAQRARDTEARKLAQDFARQRQEKAKPHQVPEPPAGPQVDSEPPAPTLNKGPRSRGR